jgi:hypothetical protein
MGNTEIQKAKRNAMEEVALKYIDSLNVSAITNLLCEHEANIVMKAQMKYLDEAIENLNKRNRLFSMFDQIIIEKYGVEAFREIQKEAGYRYAVLESFRSKKLAKRPDYLAKKPILPL